MKKILLTAVILGALLSIAAYVACVAAPLAGKHIKGSGKLVTRTMAAPAFSDIDASRAVKVIITDKAADQITIEADDNVIDYVIVKANDGELEVGIDKTIQNISNTNVTVTIPANGNIRSLEASSAATITAAIGLTASEFSMDASSAATIEAAVKATKCSIEASSAATIKAAIAVSECTVDASSASKVNLSGTAAKCNVEMSSASKLNAPKFAVTDYLIDTSSAAKATIYCTGTLHASASSGSEINYTGDCQANISKSSGGSIQKN